jgi:hypothetical protein
VVEFFTHKYYYWYAVVQVLSPLVGGMYASWGARNFISQIATGRRSEFWVGLLWLRLDV